jgi:hypothetical protein
MEKLIEFFEQEDYRVHEYNDRDEPVIELETWTNGGVNMFVYLSPPTVESFEQFVNDFNVDEEIDTYRQDTRYCATFTIRQSLEDFEKFKERLEDTLLKLKAWKTK